MRKKINTAVILAAGMGSRLSDNKKSLKILSKINNKYLIIENIKKLRKFLQIENIYIIGGYRIRELIKFFKLHDKSVTIINNKEWKKGNGYSFNTACKILNGKLFYMQCGDHFFSEKFYKKIHSSKLNFAVACSKKLNFYHDFNDATKIYSKKNIILDIGKNIEKSNGFDAGFFIINTKKLAIKKVSSSISENLKFSSKKICRLNIENDDWIDLDTKTDIKNFRIALKKKIFTL